MFDQPASTKLAHIALSSLYIVDANSAHSLTQEQDHQSPPPKPITTWTRKTRAPSVLPPEYSLQPKEPPWPP